MRVYSGIPQGTEKWLKMRAGIPTASEAHSIVTPSGKPTADTTSEKYLFQLAAERLTGQPVETPKLWWADRGKEMEDHARSGYEFERDTEVIPVSFVTDDLGRWGASPDGLVEDKGRKGSVEFKAPNAADHMAILLKSGVAFKKYGVQCQFQLFVMDDREFVDLSSYYPGLPQAIIRFERDEEMQAAFEKHVTAFSERLEAFHEDMLAKGWDCRWERLGPPQEPKQHKPSAQDQLMNELRASLIEVNNAR